MSETSGNKTYLPLPIPSFNYLLVVSFDYCEVVQGNSRKKKLIITEYRRRFYTNVLPVSILLSLLEVIESHFLKRFLYYLTKKLLLTQTTVTRSEHSNIEVT